MSNVSACVCVFCQCLKCNQSKRELESKQKCLLKLSSLKKNGEKQISLSFLFSGIRERYAEVGENERKRGLRVRQLRVEILSSFLELVAIRFEYHRYMKQNQKSRVGRVNDDDDADISTFRVLLTGSSVCVSY